MAYAPAVAAALSGSSLRQLSHWCRGPLSLIRPDQAKARGRVIYP